MMKLALFLSQTLSIYALALLLDMLVCHVFLAIFSIFVKLSILMVFSPHFPLNSGFIFEVIFGLVLYLQKFHFSTWLFETMFSLFFTLIMNRWKIFSFFLLCFEGKSWSSYCISHFLMASSFHMLFLFNFNHSFIDISLFLRFLLLCFVIKTQHFQWFLFFPLIKILLILNFKKFTIFQTTNKIINNILWFYFLICSPFQMKHFTSSSLIKLIIILIYSLHIFTDSSTALIAGNYT